MQKPYNEIILETSTLGIKIAFHTKEGGSTPLHWHEEMEILYPLNGESDVQIDGVSYRLKNKQLIVIDSHYCAIAAFTYKSNSASSLRTAAPYRCPPKRSFKIFVWLSTYPFKILTSTAITSIEPSLSAENSAS